MLQIQLRPLILLVQTPEKVVYTFPIQKLYIYYIYVCIHKHTEHFFKNHKNCNILNMLSLNTIFKIYPFLFNVDEIAYYCSIWYSNYTNVFHVFHWLITIWWVIVKWTHPSNYYRGQEIAFQYSPGTPLMLISSNHVHVLFSFLKVATAMIYNIIM